MQRLWNSLLEPVLTLLEPRDVVEIGADQGANTRNLLAFCQRAGATLHSIDPAPKFDVEAMKREHGERFDFHQGLSLNALPRIARMDAVLIDGDHNWYTTYNELKLIERAARREGRPFPLVFLHDIGWPYGRRDLYYDPETIPPAFRKPYQKRGVKPGLDGLAERGGLNPHLNHSIYENDLQNGVLTAIEDFLEECGEKIDFIRIPAINGLGVLLPRELKASNRPLAGLLRRLTPTPALRKVFDEAEAVRMETEVDRSEKRAWLGKLQERVAAHQAAEESLKAELEELRADVAARSDALQAAEGASTALREEKLGLEGRLRDGQAALRGLEEELARQAEQAEQERKRLARDHEIDLRTARAQGEEALGRLKRLQEEAMGRLLKERQEEARRAKARLEALEGELNTLRAREDDLKKALAREEELLRRQAASLREKVLKLIDAQAHAERLQAEAEELKREIGRLGEALEQKSLEYQESHARAEGLQAEAENLRGEAGRLSGQLDEARREKTELEGRVAALIQRESGLRELDEAAFLQLLVAAKDALLRELETDLRERGQDQRELIGWIHNLHRDIDIMGKSRRWRLGHGVGRAAERLRLIRRPPVLAPEDARGVLSEFEAWQGEANRLRGFPQRYAPPSVPGAVSRVEMLRRAALERSGRIDALRKETAQLAEETVTLVDWVDRLARDMAFMSNSWRWKLGNLAGRVAERLKLIPRPPILAPDEAQIFVRRFERWRREFARRAAARLDRLCGAQEDHDRRLLALERRAGRELESLKGLAPAGRAPTPTPTPRAPSPAAHPKLRVAQRDEPVEPQPDRALEVEAIETSPGGAAAPRSVSGAFSAVGEVDIVVCVHNALEDTRRCLDSVVRATPSPWRLIVVNDGSEGPTSAFLRQFAQGRSEVLLIENAQAKGYTRAANQGLRASSAAYVILLNSDTVVPPGWTDRLIECAESDPAIGIVGPLSNAASWQSVPDRRDSAGEWMVNALPEGMSIEAMDEGVERLSERRFPRLPVINGFCFLIKRGLLDRIGYLDEATFPNGYGEENDFCLRAGAAGFACAVADHVYVFHAKSRSFGHDQRRTLSEQGWAALKAKHGADRLAAVMKAAAEEPSLRSMAARLGARLARRREIAAAGASTPVSRADAKTAAETGRARVDRAQVEAEREDEYQRFLNERERPVSPPPALPSVRAFILCPEAEAVGRARATLGSLARIHRDFPITLIKPQGTPLEMDGARRVEAEDWNGGDDDGMIDALNRRLGRTEEGYVIALWAGDEIHPAAVGLLAEQLETVEPDRRPAVIVFDDDALRPDGRRCAPRFKPGFSPDYLLEHDYVGNAVWLDRTAVVEVGGFETRWPRAFLRDVLLRLWEKGRRIVKVDRVGLHCPQERAERAGEEEAEFVREAARRQGARLATVERGPGIVRPVYDTSEAMASVIIPFRDQVGALRACVESLLRLTERPRFELLLVNNNSIEPETLSFLETLQGHPVARVLEYRPAFNYSRLNNFAAREARGDVLVFLNNDTEVITPHWLAELVGDALRPGVGAVGGKLYYPDGALQHAGVVVGLRGLAGHLFAGEDEALVPSEWTRHRRNVTAVTGACLAIRRTLFEEIGGFNEQFEVTGSDVELGLRLMERGCRNVVNPEARLFHHEKLSRKPMRVRDADIRLSLIHYQPYLDEGDPFFNAHFSYNSSALRLDLGGSPMHREFRERYRREREAAEAARSGIEARLVEASPRGEAVGPDAEVLLYDVSPRVLEANQALMARFAREPRLTLRRALWFVPYFDHVYRGGIYTIFRVAQHFSERSGTHNTIVFYGRQPRHLEALGPEIREAFPRLRFDLLALPDGADPAELPPSDAALCTLWNSAYHLVRYHRCRAKYYFNQDYEAAFYPAGSVFGLIEQTYRFGFVGLANTPGVAEVYRRYNPWVESFLPGVDREVFYPSPQPRASRGPVRIVFYGRPRNVRNGFRLGIEALRRVKNVYGDKVEIISAGGAFDVAEHGLGGVIENRGVLADLGEVAALYRQCDVGLVFMFTTHPSYQPLEYMASGCATVTNHNEHNLWLLRDRENALLTEPTVSCVAARLGELVEDAALRQRIAEGGLQTVKSLRWEDALEKIHRFVLNPTMALK